VRTIAVATVILLVFASGAAAENVQPQPDIYAITSGSSQVDRVNLTNNPAFDGWPVPSPDDRQIAFVSTRSGFDAIWVMNSDGTDPRRVTDPLGDDIHDLGSIAWSPDGRTIAFQAILENGASSLYWRSLVYVSPSAGGVARRLDIDGFGPVNFSRDSRLITYEVPATTATAVVVARADGSEAHIVAPGSSAPAFARHGRRILFLRNQRRVAVMTARGRVRWTLRNYSANAASWLDDGRVAFLVAGVRRPGLYVVRPGSQQARRIVEIAEPQSLVLSPGSHYAAVSATGSTYIVRLTGGYFSRAGDEADEMAWSPDSSQLAFISAQTLTVASTSNTSVQFGYSEASEFFGLAWNGGRLLIGST
jgi:hypothetical protein